MISARDDTLTGGLAGACDGTNRLFVPRHPMRLDHPIDVWVNGLERAPAAANGYTLLGPQLLQLNEAPVPADVVAVRYLLDPVVVGIPQSTPIGLQATVVRPGAPSATCPGAAAQKPSWACQVTPSGPAEVAVVP